MSTRCVSGVIIIRFIGTVEQPGLSNPSLTRTSYTPQIADCRRTTYVQLQLSQFSFDCVLEASIRTSWICARKQLEGGPRDTYSFSNSSDITPSSFLHSLSIASFRLLESCLLYPYTLFASSCIVLIKSLKLGTVQLSFCLLTSSCVIDQEIKPKSS